MDKCRTFPLKGLAAFLTVLLSVSLAAHAVQAVDRAVFLILDSGGAVIGLTQTAEGATGEAELVRPWLDSSSPSRYVDLDAEADGGYLLGESGAIFPLGERSPLAGMSPGGETASALAMTRGGAGGWIAVADYIRPVGQAPELAMPPRLNRSIRVSDLEYISESETLAVLFETGAIALCGRDEPHVIAPLSLEDDAAIDLETAGDDWLVLTGNGSVFQVSSESALLRGDSPELGPGLAVDLETSPFGAGYYVLDAFGVIHACGGAPEVQTIPLTKPIAADLEWIEADEPPLWPPAGWQTEVRLEPPAMKLDPQGPGRNIALIIGGAENMALFTAELRIDPARLRFAPEDVRTGVWWSRAIDNARVSADYDAEQGLLTIQGGGVAAIDGGADGGGQAAVIQVAPASGVSSSTAEIRMQSFLFQDAASARTYLLNTLAPPVAVSFETLAPSLALDWSLRQPTHGDGLVRPGSIVRVDINAANAARIARLSFGLRFNADTLRCLGIVAGDGWDPAAPVQAAFATPSRLNASGGMPAQVIESRQAGAFVGNPGAVVTMFFAALEPGPARIEIDDAALYDANGNGILFEGSLTPIEFSVESGSRAEGDAG